MTKSGFLGFKQIGRQTGKQLSILRTLTVTVNERLWSVPSENWWFVIPNALSQMRKRPQRLCQMSKLTYSHEGLVTLAL